MSDKDSVKLIYVTEQTIMTVLAAVNMCQI